ncbi:hypothetical protein HO173_005493 [Letharia columbiana]|uniref:Uncharacterized protein n=1 Tax=Letharia columbiana TaxID=112416 RepID=A0A8H6FX35_9LECA|nr:uncharacterized protein HO173_005493 [Letharia columbiana]KAF6236401.1 hypothetical protein HO173_005493 [Letharia columbiana]
MGATLSCLANDVSITDYPHEAPLPARPVSQQQLSGRQVQVPRRQPLQLEYSSEHGDEVPSYRRQVAQRPRRESLPVDYEYGHDEDVARFPGVRSQRQRQRPQRLRLEYQYGHDGEIPRLPYRSSPQRGALQREASYDEDGRRRRRRRGFHLPTALPPAPAPTALLPTPTALVSVRI